MSARTWTIVVAALWSGILVGAASAGAQDDLDRFESQFAVRGLVYDNFFRAPEDSLAQEVRAAGGQLRMIARATPSFGAYLELEYIVYDEVDPSSGITAGIRLDARRHRLDLHVETLRTVRWHEGPTEARRDRPAFQQGDDLDAADVLGVGGTYSLRVSEDWEVKSLGNFQRLSFDSLSSSTVSYGYGAALRYRGLGYAFSPEVGIATGERRATPSEADHTQRDVYVKLRSMPTSFAYLSARYRIRSRDYATALPSESNFGREDDRRQWAFTADLMAGDHFVFNVYHAMETTESTLQSRGYDSRVTSAGITLKF